MKLSLVTILVSICATLGSQQKQMRTSPTGYSDTPVLPGQKWKVHDIDRPRPRMVTPGATPGAPPSDAIVLFDGKDLSKWQTMDKKTKAMGPAAWTVENGYVYSKGGIGDLVSKEKFGDIQLHHRVCDTDGDRRYQPVASKQRRASDASLRNPGARFLGQSHLCRRPGWGDLWAVAAAGERL